MDEKTESTPFWRENGARYYSLGVYYKRTFGAPVRKISVDARFSCPNIDGTVGRGGCVFCDAASFSPSRRMGIEDLGAQIDEGIKQIQRRFDADKFVAYFQPSTNTHAPVDVLERAYRMAIKRPEIVALAIGTRPDALGEPVLELLEKIAREKPTSVEIGLQTSKDETLRAINRGHDYACFVDAVQRARGRGFRLGAHLILGLPGETVDDMRLTARRVASLGIDSIKLHHLYVVKNTRLATMWERGVVSLPTLEEYAEYVADFLELISPLTVVERVAGEATEEFLIAPDWTAYKHAGRNAVELALKRRLTWQGKYYDPTWKERRE